MAATTWADLVRPGDATDFFARRTMPPFDPAAPGFHVGNAVWLAELSRLSYRRDVEEIQTPGEPTRAAFLARAGLRQRKFFQSTLTDTQAMLVESVAAPHFAALVFRGTEQRPKDFSTDIMLGAAKPMPAEVSVHQGFKAALDSVWKPIAEELTGVSSPLFFAGHSLGAALATLAAARHPPRAVYTFGSPLVGNAAFASLLAPVAIFRVVDDADLVTLVPPEPLGFRHVGAVTRLRESQGLSLNPLDWAKRLIGPPKPAADHAPINYVDRIPVVVTESTPLSV